MDNRIRSAIIVIVLLMASAAVIVLLLPPSICCAYKLKLDSFFSTGNMVVISNAAPSTYSVYIANTSQQQQQGYMNQTSIGDCNGLPNCIGMLFVFNTYGQRCFWMQNTGIPLEQSWINQNGIVTYIYNATPYSTNTICANGTVILETMPKSISLGETVVLKNQS